MVIQHKWFFFQVDAFAPIVARMCFEIFRAEVVIALHCRLFSGKASAPQHGKFDVSYIGPTDAYR